MTIRSVLVPAVMQLFGRRAWYFPEWLGRILPRLAVEPAEGDPAPTGEHPASSGRRKCGPQPLPPEGPGAPPHATELSQAALTTLLAFRQRVQT